MSPTKESAKERVLSAVTAAREELTTSEIAASTGLGRSTIGKALVVLERAGQVERRTGGRDGARRLPDRWSTTDRAAPPEQSATGPSTTQTARLRRGQLDQLVLDALGAYPVEGATPTTIAKRLDRSSGAVAKPPRFPVPS